MKDYLRTLGESLLESFGQQAKNIKLQIEMQELELDVDTAVPLGLITNELITNSLKYAFPAGKSGEIILSLKEVNGTHIRLTIADNGIGKNLDSTSSPDHSFGTRLVQLLSLQLNASLESNFEQGTKIQLDFEKA